jgi:hypothetical protein
MSTAIDFDAALATLRHMVRGQLLGANQVGRVLQLQSGARVEAGETVVIEGVFRWRAGLVLQPFQVTRVRRCERAVLIAVTPPLRASGSKRTVLAAASNNACLLRMTEATERDTEASYRVTRRYRRFGILNGRPLGVRGQREMARTRSKAEIERDISRPLWLQV